MSATDTSKTVFRLSLIYRGNSPVGHAYRFFSPLRWQRLLTVPYSWESITLPPSKDKVSCGLQCQLPHSGRWVQMGRTHTPWDFLAPSAWTTALRRNAESRWQADGELPSPRGHRWELDNMVWGNPGLDAGGKTSTPSPFPAPTWLCSVGTLKEGQHLGLCFYCSQRGHHLNSCSNQPKSSNPVVNRGMLVSWDRESSPCIQLLGILSFFSTFCFPDIY